MSNRSFAESVLALFAGRERTVAIMGDLTQLSATRGRLWFWGAYVRTLISLGWRTPVAFLVGLTAFESVMVLLPLWMQRAPQAWYENPALRSPLGQPIFIVMVSLWFTLPYALIRYGIRDRFVRVSSVAFGLATVFFVDPRLMSGTAVALIGLAGFALLLSRAWRRSVMVLVSAVAAGVGSVIAFSFAAAMATLYLAEQRHPGRLFGRLHFPLELAEAAGLLVLSVTSSILHTRFMRSELFGGKYE